LYQNKRRGKCFRFYVYIIKTKITNFTDRGINIWDIFWMTLWLCIQGESKKVWFAAPGSKLYSFLSNSPVWCFINIFLKICNFFGTSMAQKKSANLFSLKIKNSEKQKCVNKLLLSKSIIFKRFNHRISENLQNCD